MNVNTDDEEMEMDMVAREGWREEDEEDGRRMLGANVSRQRCHRMMPGIE